MNMCGKRRGGEINVYIHAHTHAHTHTHTLVCVYIYTHIHNCIQVVRQRVCPAKHLMNSGYKTCNQLWRHLLGYVYLTIYQNLQLCS